MPEPDCFLRYRISAATRNFITSGKSHVYVLAARRCSDAWFYNVLFNASRRNTFVGGTCALPSALLVIESSGVVRQIDCTVRQKNENRLEA